MAKKKEIVPEGAAPESTAVVPVPDDAAMLTALTEFREQAGSLVNVRKELLRVPRVALTQGSSKSVKAGLRMPGLFECSVKGVEFGKTVTIIPILVWEDASLMPKGAQAPICSTDNMVRNREGALCRSCPHGEYWGDWGTKDKKRVPGCKTSINILCLVGDAHEVVEMNFRKNNSPAGRSLLNLIANDVRRVPFGSQYTLGSKDKTSVEFGTFKAIDENVKQEALSVETLKEILPTVKQVVEFHKSGRLERDAGDDTEPPDTFSGGADDDVPY